MPVFVTQKNRRNLVQGVFTYLTFSSAVTFLTEVNSES